MRLIDADELNKYPIRLNHYDKKHGKEEFVFGIESVLEYAEYLPTIDPEDLRPKGEWIRPTKINGRSFDIPHCSVCEGVPCGVDENTHYCPHCGAKNGGK